MQGKQFLELRIVQLTDPALTGADRQVSQFAFALDHRVDAFFKRRPGNEAVHLHITLLTDAVGTVGRLRLHCRVPPQVVVDHVRGRRQIQAGAARFEREQEDTLSAILLEALDQRIALGARHAAMQVQRLAAQAIFERMRGQPCLGILLCQGDLLWWHVGSQ